jgi:hypothetical protein
LLELAEELDTDHIEEVESVDLAEELMRLMDL